MFELLGSAFRRPPNAEELDRLAGLVHFDRSILAAGDDDRAADHETLFGLNVLPFASVFLEPDGMLGGTVTSAAAGFRAEVGMNPPNSMPADHVSAEIELLGRLAGARDRTLFRLFLDTHFLSWYPLFVRAVEAERDDFYSALSAKVLERTLEERLNSGADLSDAHADLAPVPELLGASDTDVAEIARFFTTPVHCGIFLSRAAISRLARAGRLPRGFGRRRQMLETLLHSAATYDALEEVLNGIQSEVDATASAWDRVAASKLSAAAYWAGRWRTRLEGSSAALDRIGEALRTAGLSSK